MQGCVRVPVVPGVAVGVAVARYARSMLVQIYRPATLPKSAQFFVTLSPCNNTCASSPQSPAKSCKDSAAAGLAGAHR